MLHFIKNIIEVKDYTVLCEFNTRETRLIDLTAKVEKYSKTNDGWISRLADKEYFKTVKLDSYGTLVWNNEVDFCPDVLYEMSTEAELI